MLSCNDIIQTRDWKNQETQKHTARIPALIVPHLPCHVPIVAGEPLGKLDTATTLSSNLDRFAGGKDLGVSFQGSGYVMFEVLLHWTADPKNQVRKRETKRHQKRLNVRGPVKRQPLDGLHEKAPETG
jgi:hypothetical protein